MRGRISVEADTMLLALALWLCALPLVAILVIPWFGLKAAALVALLLLFVTLILCWGVCGNQAAKKLSRKS